MCQNDPTLEKPMCVQWCLAEALVYETREIPVADDEVTKDELEVGVAALVNNFGMEKLLDIVNRMSRKG